MAPSFVPSPRAAAAPQLRARWILSLYPDAAEAGGCFRHTGRRAPGGGPPNPERAKQEAARRARTRVRRFCAANRLNRLGTLTYAGDGCHDPRQLRQDVARFFRALRTSLGCQPLPYMWTAEWHKTGHGLHVHFALARYVRRHLICSAWGHGFVHIKLLGDLPTGSTSLDEARLAARYLSKYVGKSFDAARIAGLHRYELAQGFQPARVSLSGTTVEGVLAQAGQVMGGPPARRWSSSEGEDWAGPPAVWVAWDR